MRSTSTRPSRIRAALVGLLVLTCLMIRATAARVFDIFDRDNDVCYDEATDTFGPCDETRFPTCEEDKELICYNRRPFRDRFNADSRNPYYYIDYRSVFCYPGDWDGCSSCSPGRYCKSETRCILDEVDYPCAEWI